jgi:hypothetical protein
VSFSYNEYPSVVALASDSDLVVRGVVGKTRETTIDYGLMPGETPADVPEGQGVPVALVPFEIIEVVGGTVPPIDSTLLVVTTDSSLVRVAGEPVLAAGEELLLFLQLVHDPRGGAQKGQATFAAIVGGRQGVFDVDGRVAVARSPLVVSLGHTATVFEGDAETPGRAFIFAEIKELVAER